MRNDAPAPAMAPLVAIVGCDGAGKSTLAAAICVRLAARRPAALCYLGLGSGTLGNRIARLPLIGPATERLLAGKAAQTRNRNARIPGVPTALVVFGFSMLRYRRFRRMQALRRRGVLAVTDRYPQVEITGLYDGPGLSAARAGSRLVAWLAARERQLYAKMAGQRPTLIIRLNVDLPTALSRKPDHKPELLREKIRVTPLLSFSGARIVDLDATRPYAEVQRVAMQIVDQALADTTRTVFVAARISL